MVDLLTIVSEFDSNFVHHTFGLLFVNDYYKYIVVNRSCVCVCVCACVCGRACTYLLIQ